MSVPGGDRKAIVRAESMRLLLKQVPVMLAVNLLNATLVAFVLSRVVHIDHLAFWWVAMLALVSVRLILWWYYSFGQTLSPEQLPLWERRAFLGSLASGILWGAGPFLLFPAQDSYQIFLAFVVGGMAAGAAASLSYSLPTYFAFVLPSILPLALRFFLGEAPVDYAMGFMMLIFAGALSLFARNQHHVLTSALTLQLEKSDLANELTNLLQSLEQRVQERTAELSAANEKLSVEIAERQRAEEAERQARAEAEEANAAKSMFLAAASHDLRQPFHGLHLYLELLKRQLTTDQQRETAGHFAMALERTRDLLDAIMDLSALETGKVKPAVQEYLLQSLIGPIVEESRLQAEKKGLRLRVHPCSGVAAYTDSVLFSRMLRNLVGNALRHTEKGKILIACRARRDHARIEVWDTGPGIPQDQMVQAFAAFHQLKPGGPELGKGLGLGLWIVARTAQVLGHHLDVRSRVGHGSVFSFTVPRGRS